MAISIVSTAVYSGGRANPQTTGIVITHGFTLANDDILYAFVLQGDDLPASGGVWSSSSGGTWTQLLHQRTTTGQDHCDGILRRVVTNAAGEPSSYTFNLNNDGVENVLGIVVQVRGGDTSTPEDATTTSSMGSNDFTPANATITTNTDGAHVIIAHYACGADGTITGVKTAGAPSGWTLENSVEGAAGAGLNDEIFIEVASLVKASAGLVTPGSWTGTDDATSEYGTAAVAVKMASAGSTIIPVFMNQYRQRWN